MREPGGLGIALALTPHWVGATTVGSGELRAPAEWLPYFKADNTVNWDKLIEERGAEGMNQFIDEGADGSWLDSIQAVTVDQENGWLERAYRMWLGNQTSSINDIWKGATGFEVSQSDAVTARSLLFQRVRLDGNAHVIDRDYSWPDLGGSADNQQIMFNDYTGTGQEDVYIWAEISANDGRPVVAITGEDLRWLESILGTSLPAQMTGQELRNTLQTRKNAVNSRAQYDATIDLVTMKLNSVPSVTPNPDNISNGVRVFSGPEVATQVDHLLHGWTEEVARGDDIRHPSLATYYGVDSFADVPEAGKKRVRDWYEYAIAQGYMTYDDYEDAGLNVKLGPIASKLDIPTSVDQFDTSFQVDPGQIVAVSGDTVFLNTDATQRFFGVPANGGEMSAQMQQLQRQAAYPGAGIDNTGMPDRLRLANIQFTQQMYGDFGSTGIYVRVQGLNAPWAGMQGSAEARAALQKFFDDLDAAGGTITFGQYRPEYWGSWVNYDPARGVQHAKMWMAPQGVVLTDESVFTVKSPLGYGYPRPGYIPDYLQLWLNSGGEMPVLDYSEVE